MIADIRQQVFDGPHPGTRFAGNMQPGAYEERHQTHRLHGDGLAPGIRPRKYEDGKVVPQAEVVGHAVRTRDQGMAEAWQFEDSILLDSG